MLWFGNKKRIGKLELQVEALIRVDTERNYFINDAKSSIALIADDRCSKCENCQIMTNGTTMGTLAMPFGFSQSIDVTNPIYITAQKAIEKIMDHLGIEFDHIEEKPSKTVIKPKEATEPCQNEEK